MHRVTPLFLAVMLLLTVSPGALASVPGENGLIVYQAQTDDGVQLFTMRPDGTDVRQVTHVVATGDEDPSWPCGDGCPGAAGPEWSPDGTRLAYTHNGCHIGLIDADGGNLTLIPFADGAQPGHCERDPSFTPDGRSIVYVSSERGTFGEVWIMALDGSGRRRVSDAGNTDPIVSPDGGQVSFMLDDPSVEGELLVANIDGSGVVPVAPGMFVGFVHDWSPDCKAIVFVDHHGTDPMGVNIATVAPDGTNLTYLTHYTEPDWYTGFGSYSPDGSSIIYRLDRGDVDHAVFVMAADGSDVRQVTEFSDFRPGAMDWGPAPATGKTSPGAS